MPPLPPREKSLPCHSCPSLGPAAASQGNLASRGESPVWGPKCSHLDSCAACSSRGCRAGQSRTRCSAFGPAGADSSGRGGLWLPGLVYCSGNNGTLVPGLLKCLGVWPLPCAGGWSTLGSRPGGGTLLRNACSSIAFCLGLGCAPTPGWLCAEGGAVPLPLRCCRCSA